MRAGEHVISQFDLIESGGFPRLDAAALECVKSWTFRPATRDGVPVASLEPHRVTFRLSDAPR